MFPNRSINKYTWNSSDEKTQTDHTFITSKYI